MQGAGAALLVPLGLALLSQAFPAEKRGAAIGIFSAVTGIAVAMGPLVGGAVVQGLSWHWIFWINVPIGVIAAPLVVRRLAQSYGPRDPRRRTRAAARVRWFARRGVGAGPRQRRRLGQRRGGRIAASPGLVLLAGFARWQTKADAPMLPPELFRSRAFTAGNAAIFLTFASLFTGVFFFAQLLQVVLGYDALGAGLRLLPWTACFITIAPLAGTLADRIGERWLLSVGLALEAVGMFWLVSVSSADMTYGQMVGPFIVAGVGVSMAIPCAQNAVIGAVDGDTIGTAAGVNSMMRELGGVFGIALAVAVFAANGDDGSVLGFVDGFRPAIATAATLALVGAACGLAVPGRRALRPEVSPPAVAVAS